MQIIPRKQEVASTKEKKRAVHADERAIRAHVEADCVGTPGAPWRACGARAEAEETNEAQARISTHRVQRHGTRRGRVGRTAARSLAPRLRAVTCAARCSGAAPPQPSAGSYEPLDHHAVRRTRRSGVEGTPRWNERTLLGESAARVDALPSGTPPAAVLFSAGGRTFWHGIIGIVTVPKIVRVVIARRRAAAADAATTASVAASSLATCASRTIAPVLLIQLRGHVEHGVVDVSFVRGVFGTAALALRLCTPAASAAHRVEQPDAGVEAGVTQYLRVVVGAVVDVFFRFLVSVAVDPVVRG